MPTCRIMSATAMPSSACFITATICSRSPMKKARFTESQVAAILKEGEAGVAVAQLARNHGINPATYCHWKSKYAGAGVPELKRLRELEAENAKLKWMYADL